MRIFVLYDPGDEFSQENVKVFQSQEKLYKFLTDEIANIDDKGDSSESALLLFDKGDFDGILELYEDLTEVKLSVFETKVIK